MADLREEVLLGEPEMREAGVLRGRHVVEVLRVDHSLRVLGPWLRHLELAHQSELHVVSFLPVVRDGRDAMGRRRALRISYRPDDPRCQPDGDEKVWSVKNRGTILGACGL